jgi:sugar/nucleoside kinase (ribokinase family)
MSKSWAAIQENNKMKKVLGIGNALVDVLISLEEDELLSKFDLARGSMTLVDKAKMNAVLSHTAAIKLKKEPQKSSGGSVANTIHGLAQLGAPSGYIGKIGDDEYGAFFRSYMEQNNISATLFKGAEDSGKSIVLISPDSERTFATYLGAAIELDSSDLSLEPFKGFDYFHLEGYLVQNHALVEASVKLAKEAGCKISIDLASFNIVEENLEFLQGIVTDYVDIVFANEEEARSFTGHDDPETALNAIAEKVEIAIVKIGKKGSLIKKDGEIYRAASIKANAIDTTGAGDLYASGFFYGLVSGQGMDICGKIGSITSGKVVEVLGAKMDEDRWQQVRELIEK